jgi:CRP-like cAMP-binding protein
LSTKKNTQYRLPIFENICASWYQVLHLGIRRVFPRGTQIFDLETIINGIYLVQEGTIEILLYTHHGPEKVLYYIGPGGVFGEVSCFVPGGNSEASARARSDCICYFFTREVIENTITNQYPRLLLELIASSTYKMRMFAILIQDELNNDNFLRVCKMLIYLIGYKEIQIEAGQKQVVFNPHMTQYDVARMMGVHRVTVTKAINRLKEMGVITHFTKNELFISDFPALTQLIDENEYKI